MSVATRRPTPGALRVRPLVIPGVEIEERWNDSIDELNCQSRGHKGGYLIPWEKHDLNDGTILA